MEIENYTADDLICDETFQHYCLGNNAEDVVFWNNFIKTHPHKSEIIQEASRIFSILNAKQGNLRSQSNQLQDSIQRLVRIKDALKIENEDEITHAPLIKNRMLWLKYISGIAASIMLITIVWQFFLKSETMKEPKNKVASENTIIRNTNELRKTVVLKDGSVIILHNNSSISLVKNFSAEKRELTLSGEAFFDVAHMPLHPFIVHTAEVDIEVLGTAFNVKAYPGEAHTETSLFRGKVAITIRDQPGQKTILKPNEKMVFDNDSQKKLPKIAGNAFSIKTISAAGNQTPKEIDWVQNQLKIDDEPLVIIADKLQKWYGIEIIFSDEEVKDYRYSGTFESETVVQALEALQLSYPFKFKVESGKIIISK